MLLGHYALALAAKRAAPRASLGVLAFATELLDELWPILLLLGVERVRVAPGLLAANPLEFVHYPWSHSLVMVALWALLAGAGYLAARRYRRGAWVVGALVLSHWLLDLPMHRPDLPLWPGSPVKMGLGLWSSVAATVALELGLLAVGLAVYLRTTRPRDAIGSWGLWVMVGLLVAIFVGGLKAAPPAGGREVAVGALGLWLFVPWSWWVDRHREPVARGV